MTNRVAMFFGVTALCAQGLIAAGCSSSSGPLTATDGGTGGRSGGGGSTGGGGSMGTGTCDKAQGLAPVGLGCVNVKNKAVCDVDGIPGTADDLACFNTCGPNKSGTKNCTCTSGVWACPTCDYDISVPSKFDCYKTATATACPADPSDSSGGMLPASGGACTQDPCKPCGSASVLSYRDSGGTPKMGWCLCVPTTDNTGSVYSCASVLEWAPQCQ